MGLVKKPDPRGYKLTARGDQIAKSDANMRLALERLGLAVTFDQFSQRIVVQNHPVVETAGGGLDGALAAIGPAIEEETNWDIVPDAQLQRAVRAMGHLNPSHAVRDWLDSLESWDGEERAGKWLTVAFGVEDSDYTREVGRLLLRAMVRRVYEPGCKFDTMVVLQGSQGLGKSEALAILSGQEWFSDEPLFHYPPGQKRAEIMLGKWLNEVAELAGMASPKDKEEMKSFISKPVDNYRLPYATRAEDHPRQGVLVGTTNRDDWQGDETGGRRFAPVDVTKCDHGWLRANREQLFAEVLTWCCDEPLHLPERLWKEAAERVSRVSTVHHWDNDLEDMPVEIIDEKRGLDFVSREHCFGILSRHFREGEKPSNADHNKLRERLAHLGWKYHKNATPILKTKLRGFTRPTTAASTRKGSDDIPI